MHHSDTTERALVASRAPTIVVVAEKGGVGKTTTASNLAAALGRSSPARPGGLSVLAIDAEPQGQLALALGAEPAEHDLTVADALACAEQDLDSGAFSTLEHFAARHPLTTTNCEGVMLLSGGEAITEARDQINGGGADGERWMSVVCAFFAYRFDVIVIDTPPSVSGPLMLGSLFAADLAVTPVHANVGWSLVSLDKLAGHLLGLGDAAPVLLPVAQAVDRRLNTWRDIDSVVRAEAAPGGYMARAAELVATVVPERERNGPWLAQVPQSKTIERGSLSGEPIVVGRRSGSIPGLAMRDMATRAYALAVAESRVAK